jgi:hypothetical protein
MYTSEGTVDVWHWKASRGNPLGYVDDKYWIAIEDTTAGGETRLGDGGNSTYDDNAGGGDPNPPEIATIDPNANVDFLARDASALAAWDPFGVMGEYTVELAVDYTAEGWTSGSTVAGYINEVPDGSRSDVRVAGDYDSGVWTLEIQRSLTTSGSNDIERDVQFDPAMAYEFTVAEFDNTGGVSHQTDMNVHTLVFQPAAIGGEEGMGPVPLSYRLDQNYPNPFNPSTVISYVVPGSRETTRPVSLEIYNLRGQFVRSLVSDNKGGGEYSVHWNGTDEYGVKVESGIYLYRLQTGEITSLRKMTLLK